MTLHMNSSLSLFMHHPSAITFAQPNAWVAEHMRADFHLTDFPPGARVLDIGCGCGKNLSTLMHKGIHATGIDPDPTAVEYCRHLGLAANVGRAEALPAADESLDGCLLDQVIQFTDVPAAVREVQRVLKPCGTALIATAGAGYALYTAIERSGLGRLFGLRMLANALVFRLFARRLPGWLGDTLALSVSHLASLVRASGLEVETMAEGRRFGAMSTFVYVKARKAARLENKAVAMLVAPSIDQRTTCAE